MTTDDRRHRENMIADLGTCKGTEAADVANDNLWI